MNYKISKSAVISFILAIVSFVALLISSWIVYAGIFITPLIVPLSVLSLMFGIFGLRDIRKNKKKGKGFAIIGIVVSSIILLLIIFIGVSLARNGWVS